jgi:hypothetical protein
MDEREVRHALHEFFPRSFKDDAPFLREEEGRMVLKIIEGIDEAPLSLTQANQLLHLCHEAGMSEGFFRYYFLTLPDRHPYPVDRVCGPVPDLGQGGVTSLGHVVWGLRRLFIDALLFWGNIRSAYRDLRVKGLQELEVFFAGHRINSERMRQRGEHYEFREIADGDRYLISELACKAYDGQAGDGTVVLEGLLLDLYRKCGKDRVTVRELLEDKEGPLSGLDPGSRGIVQMGAEDIKGHVLSRAEDVHEAVEPVRVRFDAARPKAAYNTRLYLSLVNELDVYVATSMRTKQHFEDMARDCRRIFGRPGLRRLNVRYFDPTMAAASCHEDKGLIECLMVKCSKATLYFAGDRDSFGKDAEVAMSLSLGKPVVILCPDTPQGVERERFFRDIHPLSRLINFSNGVANGAVVTRDVERAGELLERVFTNRMEYDLERRDEDYFLLKERLTGSVVRLQTNDRLLLETFWNYYHQVP